MSMNTCKKRECNEWINAPHRYNCRAFTKDALENGVCAQVARVYDISDSGVSRTQELIREECNEILDILLEKNRKYGDSAINPVRVFSSASDIEQINVRLDDKLSRIINSQDDDTEDTELDIIGYLILKRVQRRTREMRIPIGKPTVVHKDKPEDDPPWVILVCPACGEEWVSDENPASAICDDCMEAIEKNEG